MTFGLDAATARAPDLAPVEERIAALDVVRGYAVFGILMVNIETFGGPYPLFRGEPWVDPASQTVYALVDLFFVSKFFPLFSLLFGIGVSLQMKRIVERGGNVARFVARRLGGLFLIGLVHVALFSTIDILVQYAILGWVLLALRRLSARGLLAFAFACLTVPVVLASVAAFRHLFQDWYSGQLDAAAMIRAYGHGTLREVWRTRAIEIRDYYVWVGTYCGWEVLAMFAFGTWAVRSGIVERLALERARLASLCRGAFALGLPAAAVHALLFITYRRIEHPSPFVYVGEAVAGAIGEPSMAIGYATGIALLITHSRWAERLRPFADVGRMALSNYVLQSIVMGFVFFSYGFGQYGRFSPIEHVLFVVALYATQVVLSRAWMLRFRFGPLEAAWRAMTYGRWPRMRHG